MQLHDLFQKNNENKNISSQSTDSDLCPLNGLCYKALELIPDSDSCSARLVQVTPLFLPYLSLTSQVLYVNILNP